VKGPITTWAFTLAYAPMEDFMPLAQEQLAASRLPYADQDEVLQVHFAAKPLVGTLHSFLS